MEKVSGSERSFRDQALGSRVWTFPTSRTTSHSEVDPWQAGRVKSRLLGDLAGLGSINAPRDLQSERYSVRPEGWCHADFVTNRVSMSASANGPRASGVLPVRGLET